MIYEMMKPESEADCMSASMTDKQQKNLFFSLKVLMPLIDNTRLKEPR